MVTGCASLPQPVCGIVSHPGVWVLIERGDVPALLCADCYGRAAPAARAINVREEDG